MSKKDKGKEKEISPHTPYIEKERDTEKEILKRRRKRSLARACEEDLERQTIAIGDFRLVGLEERQRYVSQVPSLETVLRHNQLFNVPPISEEIVRTWYGRTLGNMWMDIHGNPIRNWPAYLMNYALYYGFNQHDTDPERLPDARKSRQDREADEIERRKAEFEKRAQEILNGNY